MKSGYTHVAVLIDRSGSMRSIRNDVIGGFNTLLDDQKKVEGTLTVSTVQFDHSFEGMQYESLNDFAQLNEAVQLNESNYVPRGGTPLNDALARLIIETGAKLASLPEEERPEKVLIVSITDGEENASKEYDKATLKKMIEEQETKFAWKFMYIGANQDSFAEGAARGMKAAYNFKADMKGTSKMSKVFSSTLSSYRSSKLSANMSDISAILKEESDKADAEEAKEA